MNPTIKDIAKFVAWPEVNRAVKYFYPKDRSNYLPVFKQIRVWGSNVTKPTSKEQLVLRVKGRGIDTPAETWYGINTNKYSLSFRKWKEICNIPISTATLEHYKYEDILAHFIWEITFYGPEKKMEETGKELMRRAKDVKKQLRP